MYRAVDFLFGLNPFSFVTILAPVVQTLDSGIHRIKIYPLGGALWVSLILIHWIVIYPMDTAIQRLNNRGL